ncbi:MAG: hypothetical protein ACK5NK_02190 [Niabella sp.]
MKRKLNILKKTIGLALFGLTMLLSTKAFSQACTFVSPLVQVITSKDTTIGGVAYCKSIIDLSVDIDVNGGNKWTYIHLWTTSTYPSWDYSNNGAPTTANALSNNLLTLALQYGNTAPTLSTTYPPDGAENVQDAADGVTFTQSPISGSTATHFTFHNVALLVPGVCDPSTSFKGDSWSSQANNGKTVQCSLTGFSFAIADPTVEGGILCGTNNVLDFTVTANGTGNVISFQFDVYANTNNATAFDPNLDTKIYNGTTTYTIDQTTASAPSSLSFSSSTMSLIYPAPYSTTIPQKYQDIYVVLKNITITNGSTTTNIDNALVHAFANQCQALPNVFGTITALYKGGSLFINWESASEDNVKEYIIQASKDGVKWKDIGRLDPKSVNGNSTNSLLYEFIISSPITMGAVGLAFALLLLPAFKSRLARGLLLIVVISGVILACSKNSKEVKTDKDTLFIRIAQYDKDSNVPIYSKTIRVVNQ